MNHNTSIRVTQRNTTSVITSLVIRFVWPGVALAATFGGMRCANAAGFLPDQMIVSTVPQNGDLNPYGVAFVPKGFEKGTGPLRPGDILVSNFNNSMNLQGTGTTIVRVSSNGEVSRFFAGPPHPGGSIGLGLSTALAVLRNGFVIVGNVPSRDGTAATVMPGSLLVINNEGHVVSTISGPQIQGPWDMTVDDEGNRAIAFVSMVLSGKVLRLDLNVSAAGVMVTNMTEIASGYRHRGDPAAFEVGPTGLVFDRTKDLLYVASTDDNAVFAIDDAAMRHDSEGRGRVIYTDPVHLHGPLGMAEAPNGHLLVANSDVINSNPNLPSEIVEFTKQGTFVRELSVDPAQGGSFGLSVNVDDQTSFFAAVDDNTATLTIWTIPLEELRE